MRSLNKNSHNHLFIKLIPYLLFLGILGITLLSLLSLVGWNIFLEQLSHFKLQYLIVGLVLFALLLLTRKKLLILISLFCISLLLAEILPWYISLSPKPGNNIESIRILSSNLNTQNKSYSKILSVVRKEKPEIAVFLEVNDAWIKQLDSVLDILPYSIKKPNPYNLGIAVYSKQPLTNASINLFGTDKNNSIVGNFTMNGQLITLIATHPLPPVKPTFFHSRNQQLDKISQYIQKLKTPVVMVGDLNITMWSPYYKRFINKTGLHNAQKGFGILPSWPMKASYSQTLPRFSFALSIPIDHCLISPEIKVKNIRTGPNVGSDHRPLIADLVIPEKK
ncbi:endonuclease/exonuclease/phosphatase family protein [Coleofasciculus sp. FACHB-542]|uniref:endonuclease/exonuclease/phosphatase family protein n=1 Tax=Cyanophyceae TaxID=3028117 RepID=UPI00168216D8|nr:endonuclease/exonuclease/phosphatase family protein [Coleofasciculus sp. FACHB-542]MBD2087697.1 endonuclease/exonuclease/phosphatase family protein [Coleofasciculus sp. FACHB-542]